MNKKNNVYLADLKDYLIDKFESANSLRFTNIIDYAKSAYNISVIDLAKLFDVERATIYNYINGKNEIPKKVIDTIISIYGVSSYREVIILERIPNFYRAKIELIEKGLIDLKITNSDLANLKSYQTNSEKKFDIRNEICHRDKWLFELRNKKKNGDFNSKDPNVAKMVHFMSQNNNDYNKTLVELILQSRANDQRLLLALDRYLSTEQKVGNLGEVTSDPQIIQNKIDEIVNRKDTVIQVGYEDFNMFPKTHVQFKLKTLSILDFILPHIEFQVKKIVLSVRSRSDVRLSVIHEIINSIRENYGLELNLVFSSSISDRINNDIIDIFFMA